MGREDSRSGDMEWRSQPWRDGREEKELGQLGRSEYDGSGYWWSWIDEE
jgi:hypothetical protein